MKLNSNWSLVYEVGKQFKTVVRPQDYPDVLSDGFEALWRACEAYDSDKGMSRKSYLMTIVRQRMIDGLRSRYGRDVQLQKKKRVVLWTWPLEDCHDVASDFEWNPEDIRFTENQIEKILETARQVHEDLPEILFLHSEGWTYVDIAKDFGVSAGTITSRIYKMRQLLK